METKEVSPEQIQEAMPPGWQITPKPKLVNHPLTITTLAAIVMGVISIGGWSWWLRSYTEDTARARSEARIMAHQAPDVAKVHDVSKLMPRAEHTRDMTEAAADRAAIRAETQLIIKDVSHKLDALVEKDRQGQYRRRQR